MDADGTAPASDEIAVMGARTQPQWAEAMGENGTIYRWNRATNTNYRYRPGGGGLAARLQSVVDAGLAKGFKPYAGPVIGGSQQDRQGDPGYDCSSFVALMYGEALSIDFPVQFTDTIASQTDEIDESEALPGDIVFFRYDDDQDAIFPHMGLWLGGGEMLDCQFPAGLGVHPLLNHPFEIHRARGL
jgi:cell wall-associated NlpC family hydrolase